MCLIILPFTYFFYETTEDLDYKSRFCTAFRNEILLFIVFSLIHFPMFGYMRHALIPVESLSYKGLEGATLDQIKIDQVFLSLDDAKVVMVDDTQVFEYIPKVEIGMQLTFAQYTIGAAAFFGSFLFVFFAGTGLVAVPFNHIIAWADRPKPMKKD